MNSIVVYTCVTGGYDSLKQPKVVTKGIDYICFTDNLKIRGGAWKLRPIPEELKYLSNVKKQRVIKICPHRYLKEYDISIWVDGNLEIQRDLVSFIKQYDLDKCPLYVRVHPCRRCIYEEAKACIALGKDSKEVIEKQVAKYRDEGYPANAGMFETCVVLRQHANTKCQLVCNRWVSELLCGSHRDQLSFNYACWREHFLPECLNGEFSVYGDEANTFRLCRHGR